jgi:hypothetical protein
MGNRRITVQNLEVVNVDAQNNMLLVKGSVPGHDNSYLVVRKSIKGKKKPQVVEKPKAPPKSPPKAPSKAPPKAKKEAPAKPAAKKK